MIIQDWSQIEVWNLAAAKRKLQIPDPFTPTPGLPSSPLFELAASAGKLTGVVLGRTMGHNPDVDAGTVPEDIWEAGGLYPFQAAPVALEVVSTSANDTAAGTGMRTVTVTGLDAGYNEQTEIVTLNGVAPVALAKTYLRINNLAGVSAGTGLTNAGVITLRVPGPGAVQGVIGTGDGRAHQAIYTVPNGVTAYITHGEFQMLRVPTADAVELELRLRPLGAPDISRALFSVAAQGSSSYQRTLQYPVVVQSKTDLRVAVSFASTINIGVTATLFFLLIDNDIW